MSQPNLKKRTPPGTNVQPTFNLSVSLDRLCCLNLAQAQTSGKELRYWCSNSLVHQNLMMQCWLNHVAGQAVLVGSQGDLD